MISIEEFGNTKPMFNPSWFSAIEMYRYFMKGKRTEAYYHRKDFGGDEDAVRYLRKHLSDIDETDTYQSIIDETFKPTMKLVEEPSTSGEIVIERYLDGVANMFDEPYKRRVHRPGMTIIFEIAIPVSENRSEKQRRRFDKVYRLVTTAENDGCPCRVIAAAATRCSERHEEVHQARKVGVKLDSTIRTYWVIKDYEDPIFPGIWGPMSTSYGANQLMVAYMSLVVGTNDYTRGQVATYDVAKDMPPDEEIIIVDASYLNYDGTKDNSLTVLAGR